MLRRFFPSHRRTGRVGRNASLRCLTFAIVVCLALLAPSSAGAFVYWSSLFGVGRANLDGSAGDSRFIPVSPTCGMAVTQSRIYWGIDRGSIGVGGLDGSVINGHLLDAPSYYCGYGGIAADATHIYWANENQPDFDTIGRAKLDGSGVDQRFVTAAINPCGVAVDRAHIYWATGNSGRGPGTTIGRANLDGSSVDENFITGVPGPCGVAVDVGHIYWGNMNTGTIGRANLNGSAVEIGFITGATSPCGVAVDSAHIYWADAGDSRIGRANLDGSGANQAFIVDTRGQCNIAVDPLIAATVNIEASLASIIYGEKMTFTTKVSGSAGTPTGTVQFQVDGHDVGEPAALNAQGGAGFEPPFHVDVGSTITARYGGDSTYGPSRSDVQPHVQQAATATSLTSSVNPAPAGGEVTITASVDNLNTDVTPFGSVQFFIDGTPVLAPQPLDDNGRVEIIDSDIPPHDDLVSAAYHDDSAAVPDFADSRASLTQHVVVPGSPSPPGPAIPASPTAASVSSPAGPVRVTVVAGRHPTVKLRRGRFVVDTDQRASCPAGGPACTVNVVGRAPAKKKASAGTASHRTITVGRAILTIRPGHHAELLLALNKQGVKLLRARKRLVITTTTTTRVGDKPSRSLVNNLTVKLPRPARPSKS